MRLTRTKRVVGVALTVSLLASAAPAFADLIPVNGLQNNGTGIGAVLTVVTVQDNGNGSQQNNVESGCVTYTGNLSKPGTNCFLGLQGADNTSGSAGNNTYLLSNIAGLTSAGQIGFVVNVSEGGPGGTATLTDLYLSLYNMTSNTRTFFPYVGAPLILGDSGGIGQSGINRFILNDAEAATAALFCPVLSQCVIEGGIQFAAGTTDATPETIYVQGFTRDGTGGPGGGKVPEPASLALFGIGLLGYVWMRRRQ